MATFTADCIQLLVTSAFHQLPDDDDDDDDTLLSKHGGVRRHK
jgi:hypothetical protein